MRAAKVDENHQEVVLALRTVGATVHSLAAVGKGVPDLLVGYQSQTFLMEIKDGRKIPSEQKLTAPQVQWHASWKGGPLAVVKSAADALKMIGAQ